MTSRLSKIPKEPLNIPILPCHQPRQPDDDLVEANRRSAWEKAYRDASPVDPKSNKKVVTARAAFHAVFPKRDPDAISDHDMIEAIAQDGLRFVNTKAGCDTNKSPYQKQQEPAIVQQLKECVLISTWTSYARRKNMKQALDQAKKEMPTDCYLLFEPSMIIEFFFLREYKGISGTGNRTGGNPGQVQQMMGEHNPLKLLKTSYENSFKIRWRACYAKNILDISSNAGSAVTVRQSSEGSVVSEDGPRGIRPQKRAKVLIGDTTKSPRFINGMPFRLLQTPGTNNLCGLYALQFSLIHQLNLSPCYDNQIFHHLHMTVSSEEFQRKVTSEDRIDKSLPPLGPRIDWFSEDELALVLQMWVDSENNEEFRLGAVQLGIYQDGRKPRIVFKQEGEGIRTIWIHHDDAGHWSGIEFYADPSSGLGLCAEPSLDSKEDEPKYESMEARLEWAIAEARRAQDEILQKDAIISQQNEDIRWLRNQITALERHMGGIGSEQH